MSPVQEAALWACVAVSVTLSVFSFAFTSLTFRKLQEMLVIPARRENRADDLDMPLRASGAGTTDPVEDRRAAVPIDPSNPPRIVTYQERWNQSCTCHGRGLHAGEQVIWWPRPDRGTGAVELYCPNSIEEQRR